jgi:hypothetical protein
MSLDPAVIRRPGLGAEFGKGQVLVNYARVSLGPWRLKALIDRAGHPVSSRYIVTRPKTREWSLEALWGLLNSPFANAYVYCHSVERDNLVGTVRKVPIPACEVDSVRNLTSLVAQHFEHVASEGESLWSKEHRERAHRDMLAIDAEVMRLYDLPPRLERQLLDFFAGWKRAGVPFDFRRYFPADFESCIPLHEYLSQEYQRSTIGFADEWVKKHRSPEVNAVLRKAVEAFEED